MTQVLGVDQCLPGYVGSEDSDTNEDRGKGVLSREQLEKRERTFMEMYSTKSVNRTSIQSPETNKSGQALLKRARDIFT